MNRTLILVKPDGVQRGLTGQIITRFEMRGLKLVGMKLMQMSREMAEEHYGEHRGKPFFEGLVQYITSGPIIAMVWEGPDAISAARATMGSTKPVESTPGTIRGDFGLTVGRNLVHGSDGEQSAAREINLFFEAEELLAWGRDLEPWIISD